MAASLSSRIRRALRTSIHNNAMVYGYSVMITAAMATLQVTDGPMSLRRILLFITGATLAFTCVEAAASNLFRQRVREERSEVVVLGSAMSLISVGLGVVTTAFIGEFAPSWTGWVAAPYAATVVYLLGVSIELVLAEGAEERAKRKS